MTPRRLTQVELDFGFYVLALESFALGSAPAEPIFFAKIEVVVRKSFFLHSLGNIQIVICILHSLIGK